MPRTKNNSKNKMRSLKAENFYSDFTKEGTLYAALVRSPASTGKIKNILLIYQFYIMNLKYLIKIFI